jgi:hypothetical protein
MEALGFTAAATGLRLYFNTFEGFTFRYWGDFEFFVFLTIVNAMYLQLRPFPMIKYYGIAFVARELVRQNESDESGRCSDRKKTERCGDHV